MAEPIHLPLAKVIEAGRKAYLEGRLSAQGPTPDGAYRDQSGRPCIIGAAMTDEEAAPFRNHLMASGISTLVSIGRVVTDDRGALEALQIAHDKWAGHEPPEFRERAHQSLRRLLGLEDGQ